MLQCTHKLSTEDNRGEGRGEGGEKERQGNCLTLLAAIIPKKLGSSLAGNTEGSLCLLKLLHTALFVN